MTGGALIAALPMYDGPGTAQANDAIWAAIAVSLRDRGVAAPERLTRGGDLAVAVAEPEPRLRPDLRLSLCQRLA